MKPANKMTLSGLVLTYVKYVALSRLVSARKKSMKAELLSRVSEKAQIICGWRIRKGWRGDYTGTQFVYRPAHWELDIRRDTRPLRKAQKP